MMPRLLPNIVLLILASLCPAELQPQGLTPTLFYDGSTEPRLAGATFGEPVVDSHGNLIVISNQSPGAGSYFFRVNSLSTSAQLTWQTNNLNWDTFASPTPVLGPGDVVYIHPGYETIYAFTDSGTPLPAPWPITISAGTNSKLVGLPVIDPADGTLYGKSGVYYSFTNFPSRVEAINPDGSRKWPTPADFASGDASFPVVLGPSQNIYTIMGDAITGFGQLVELDRATGSLKCQVQRRSTMSAPIR
jgi:hypothetical protein